MKQKEQIKEAINNTQNYVDDKKTYVSKKLYFKNTRVYKYLETNKDSILKSFQWFILLLAKIYIFYYLINDLFFLINVINNFDELIAQSSGLFITMQVTFCFLLLYIYYLAIRYYYDNFYTILAILATQIMF
ncbi:MAG: hypothetical protein ACK5HS_00580 [Mycoplasmatales bacterium]